MIIVFEGLEGAGKTTLGESVSHALSIEYLKTPPKEFTSLRTLIASSAERHAAFYFYLSGLFLLQKPLQTFKSSVRRHVVVDRYIHSTIAYHDRGATLEPPPYDVGAIIPADFTVHITCSNEARLRRVESRGFHIFERAHSDENAIYEYFRTVCDTEFSNESEVGSSVARLVDVITEWLAKDKDSLG